MGRQSNLYNQNRHQYDFLNPDNKKNLALDPEKKQWVEAVETDYPFENKEDVKQMEADIKSMKSDLKEQVILLENQTPFKMKRFQDVEPCIKAKELENRIAD